jgi:hypothetical protein
MIKISCHNLDATRQTPPAAEPAGSGTQRAISLN